MVIKRALSLLLLLGLLLGGCGYEREVTRVEKPGAVIESPDPARYGTLRLVWVREYRKPKGLSAFPDGGKALETALYAIVNQTGGGTEREIGRIVLEPVRKNDFGNLNDMTWEWKAPDRLAYRVKHGYAGTKERVTEGDLQVPPLP